MKNKTTLIVAIIIITGVITWFVWKSKKSNQTNSPLTPRVQKLVDRVPLETRKKIVNLYNWYVKNGDTIILKNGKVYNVTKQAYDEHNRTSIQQYRLDGVLWDLKTNRGLIDAELEWWLAKTMKFTMPEYVASLNV